MSWTNEIGERGALYRGTGNGQRAAIAVNECGVHARSSCSQSRPGDQKADAM